MLCAIDTSLDLLMSVNASVAPAGTNTSQISQNTAPTIARPISISNPTQAIVKSVGLSVLGSDNAGEASLVYRWEVIPVTPGTSGAFSSNATNAAKNTNLTFTRAGEYYVRVTITDQGRLSVSNALRVSVSQILTSIQVTPGTSSITAGRSQPLTARGLDQFQQPLLRQPAFTWTASSGSINASGLFTAPSAATEVTVTARSGSLSATARIAVIAATPTPTPTPTPVVVGIQTPALANLVSTYYADGSINRTEMIALLRSAGSDGRVDATELSDFRYIVSNATRYLIPGYVQVLASNIVNTNPANSLYKGETAGNLAAGSSATVLNNLVDKWFMGTDLPTLTSSSLGYQIAAGSLFNGTPSTSNMKQGSLGDCYLIASLGAVADRSPSAVSNMFIDNGDGTFTVRFFTGSYGSSYNTDGTISDGFRSGTGTADYVTVNRSLPTYSNGMLAYSGMGSQVSNAANTLWIALAEKAYAQWNATGKSGRNWTNSYGAIEGGWMGVTTAQILGYNTTSYYTEGNSSQALISALGTNKAVTIGTRSAASAGGLVGGHAYVVSSYNASTQTFTLKNPWGTSNPSPLTWAQLQTNCNMFIVANASISTPISMNNSTPNVRVSVEASNSVFVVTISTKALDSTRNQSTNETEQIVVGGSASSASSSSGLVDELYEFDRQGMEDIGNASESDHVISDAVDQALTAIMDAILDIENFDHSFS